MIVKNWMSQPVITIDANDSMQTAMKLMKTHGIRMLPVLKNGKLKGIVTDRDLKRTSASDATSLEVHELLYLISTLKVEKIMTPEPITIPFDFTVEETAEVLLKNKISGVPVLDEKGSLAGIITQTDLLRVIISLTGIGRKGIQFGFLLADRPGSIKEVADIIRYFGGRITSVLTSYEKVPEGYRWGYIRVYGIDRNSVQDLKAWLQKKARLLYMVDHRENKREIYS